MASYRFSWHYTPVSWCFSIFGRSRTLITALHPCESLNYMEIWLKCDMCFTVPSKQNDKFRDSHTHTHRHTEKKAHTDIYTDTNTHTDCAHYYKSWSWPCTYSWRWFQRCNLKTTSTSRIPFSGVPNSKLYEPWGGSLLAVLAVATPAALANTSYTVRSLISVVIHGLSCQFCPANADQIQKRVCRPFRDISCTPLELTS